MFSMWLGQRESLRSTSRCEVGVSVSISYAFTGYKLSGSSFGFFCIGYCLSNMCIRTRSRSLSHIVHKPITWHGRFAANSVFCIVSLYYLCVLALLFCLVPRQLMYQFPTAFCRTL